MSNKQFRIAFRYFHMFVGALIATLIYSAELRQNDTFLLLMQVVVMPLLIVSGLVLWQQPRLLKLFRRSQ